MKLTKEKKKTHSSTGASTCSRWWNCPGSVALCASMPKEEPSAYADEGTAAHELCELGLSKGIKVLESWEGDSLYVGDREIEVTEEMIEGVKLYVDTINKDMKDLNLDKSNLRIEKKFILDHIDEGAYGTCDACLVEPFGLLRVYDFKFGAGVAVDVVDNKQLLFYASGAAMGEDITEIELVIVQPRARHADGPVRRWRTSLEYLRKFEDDLKWHIAKTKEANAELKEGSWCKFCAGKPVCGKVQKTVMEVAQTDFITLPPNPVGLDMKDLVKILSYKDLITDWLKDVETHAFNLMQQGQNVPGYKLVKKKANRKWVDEVQVIEEFEDLYGDDIFSPRKLLTPAQMEKLVGKKNVEALCETQDTGLTIAPESDKREEVKANAIDDFTNV